MKRDSHLSNSFKEASIEAGNQLDFLNTLCDTFPVTTS